MQHPQNQEKLVSKHLLSPRPGRRCHCYWKKNPRPSSTEPSSSDCPVGVSKKTAKMPDVSPTAVICAVTLACEPTQQPAVGPWNSSKTVVFSLAGRAGFVELSASNCNPIAMHDGMVTVLVLVVLLVLLLVLLVLVVLALALVGGAIWMVPPVAPPPTARAWILRRQGPGGSQGTTLHIFFQNRILTSTEASPTRIKSASSSSSPHFGRVFGKHSENGSITVGLKV